MRLDSFSVVLTALLGLCSSPALFGIALPPQGGGGSGGGTIYFSSAGRTMTMNSDGGNRQTLPLGVEGEPSLILHGGHRWFLQSRNLSGQTYPSGRTRHELFAVRDDGNSLYEVQLTDQPDLESNFYVRWSHGDTVIAFGGRRWDLGASQILDGGIYSAAIAFDASGNVQPVVSPPTSPLVPVPLVLWPANGGDDFAGGMGPDLQSFAWSPTGTRIVYESQSRTTLRVATIGGGVITILSGTWCAVPAWSPTGSPIAFTNQVRGISTIRPDGTGVEQISKGNPNLSYSSPQWSPTGSHIAYQIWDGWSFPWPQDVGRMTAAGRSKTSLTSNIVEGGAPIAWR